MTSRSGWLVLLMAMGGVWPAMAAQVELHNGTILVGTILERGEELLRIDTGTLGVQPVRLADVRRIVEDGAVAAPPAEGGEVLRLAGSNTIGAQLAPSLADAWARRNGAADVSIKTGASEVEKLLTLKDPPAGMPMAIDIKAHGSGTAFEALAKREADIGMSSRRIKGVEKSDQEVALLRPLDPALPDTRSEHVIALDGLAVIVHPSNPVKALSLRQIAGLFAGDVPNWSNLGGPDCSVNLYRRNDDSGTFDTFKSLVMDPFKLSIRADATPFEDSAALSDEVAGDRCGIGFIGLAYQRKAKPLAIRVCEASGMAYMPSAFAVKTEDYPLFRRLYLYTPAALRNNQVEGFAKFAQSEDAWPIVAAAEFVTLEMVPEATQGVGGEAIEAAAVARTFTSRMTHALLNQQQAPVLQRFAKGIDGAQRLSATFRFETGSSVLDVRARADLDRLGRFIADGGLGGRTLAIYGFADAVGDYNLNLRLSRDRARAVADGLRERGVTVPDSAIDGFGEEAPVACNEDKAGQARNRHVEVWMR